MADFRIFDTNDTSIKEQKRRHILLLLNAVILGWIVWCIVNFRHFLTIPQSEMLREILLDMLENLVEIVVLVELSLLYSRIIIKIFWNRKRTLVHLFSQILILTVLNVLTALAMGEGYHLIFPEEEGLFLRISISDFIVVSVLTMTYFVSFIISRYHNEEKARLIADNRTKENEVIALQAKLDKLALQTNNHFMFNCFSTLGGMIRTAPEDAEKFLQGLSEMYRYLVRNGDRHLIPLKDEIRFTENYVRLVHYRYDGIKVDIDDSVRKVDAFVSPVSIQQLVENAVKHNRHGGGNLLSVEVLRDGDCIEVRNNILERKDRNPDSSGSGLKNLGDRVRLISGKDIEVLNDGATFTVRVPLVYEEDLNNESLDY